MRHAKPLHRLFSMFFVTIEHGIFHSFRHVLYVTEPFQCSSVLYRSQPDDQADSIGNHAGKQTPLTVKFVISSLPRRRLAGNDKEAGFRARNFHSRVLYFGNSSVSRRCDARQSWSTKKDPFGRKSLIHIDKRRRLHTHRCTDAC